MLQRKMPGYLALALLVFFLVPSLGCSLTVSVDKPSTQVEVVEITKVIEVTELVRIIQEITPSPSITPTYAITITPTPEEFGYETGNRWQEQDPLTPPSPRKSVGMVYDAKRNVLVSVGGTDWAAWFNETWEYDGLRWILREDVDPLLSRGGSAVAYDPDRAVTVLFGGSRQGDDEFLNDTWVYDGQRWSQEQTRDSPPRRNGAAMAYDTERQCMVLFGGYDRFGSPRFFDDTWEYIDGEWIQRFPRHHPEAREAAHMVYDTARGVMVLFGGGHDAGSVTFGDTWEWNGEDWIQRQDLPAAPPPRWAHFMAYDEERQRTVLFGGLIGVTGQYNDTWEYDGETWTQVTTLRRPPARWDGGMVYDSQNDRMVLFGGQYWDQQFGFLNDTWYYIAPFE